MDVEKIKHVAIPACREFKVKRLDIFGSLTRGEESAESDVLDPIREHRSIVSFRNILAHGYDSVDNRIVWGIIEDDLDKLLADVKRLLEEENRKGNAPEQ